jgi:hypothetical protein
MHNDLIACRQSLEDFRVDAILMADADPLCNSLASDDLEDVH